MSSVEGKKGAMGCNSKGETGRELRSGETLSWGFRIETNWRVGNVLESKTCRRRR